MKRIGKEYWFVGIGALLGVGLFLGAALARGKLGFPLDDAWIHQTYARNLVRNGRWEYVPGVISAGSTAPLWTLLLAVGYLLRLPYLWWAYLLGGVSLGWLGLVSMRLWRCLWPKQATRAWLAGLMVVLTWPLVWAATSGMETLLFAALGLQIAVIYCQSKGKGWQTAVTLGLLSGLLILTRPDGLVLIILILAGMVLARRGFGLEIGAFLGAMALPLVPYFVFNWISSHTIWPNTFYAKQAEYGTLLLEPLWARLWELLYFSWGGTAGGMNAAHLLLLPGLVTAVWLALRADWQARQLRLMLPLLWAGGHIFLYAWRLPVTYQHGRYLLAAVPIWVLFGLWGWLFLLDWLGSGRYGRLGRQVAGLTMALIVLVFLILGATTGYANDVAFIENEMVAVSHWLAEHTAVDALIAAHDIGAIGYFAERPIIDLAGLISPEIIPLLADEVALDHYVLNSEADYLVTAPGWLYVDVTTASTTQLLYTTNYAWTQDQGLNNMAIYALKPSLP